MIRVIGLAAVLAAHASGPAAGQGLRWQLAVPRGIEVNPATQTWQSGRVHGIVELPDGSAVVATNGGGVWWASRTGDARPLSDAWNDPDTVAIARGSDSQYHVYVSTTAGNLYENQSTALDGFQIINTPPGATVVRGIAVLRGPRRIAVACDNGVFWADIPLPGAPRAYTWRAATGAGAGSDWFSLALRSAGASWSALATPTADRLTTNRELAVVSRSPIHRDVFWVDPANARVRSSWEVLGTGWAGHTFDVTHPGFTHPQSRLAVVARSESHLDLFYAGFSGQLQTSWWDGAAGDWLSQHYEIGPPGSVGAGGAITAIARTPDTLDVLWVTPERAIKHRAWSAQTGAWTAAALVAGPGGAAASTRIAVASRAPELLNVFWLSPNGEVKTNWWQAGNAQSWQNLYTIPSNGPAAIGGGIAVAARDPDKLDVVWIAADGRLMTTYWNAGAPEQWVGHAYALSAPGAAALDNAVALVSRNPLHLDAFWLAADGSLRTSYWNELTAPRFADQSYSLGLHAGLALRSLAVSSAHDDELSAYTVASDGALAARRWIAADGVVIAGRTGGSASPIARGALTSAGLALTAATISGGDGVYSTTSVATSKYATASWAVIASGGAVKYVVRSDDGGASWARAGVSVPGATCGNPPAPGTLPLCAGGQGEGWNNAIAVSPVRNDRVYLGWVGLFSTSDGGASWRQVASEHVHPDIPRVQFGDHDRRGRTAYFSTDGGLSATFDDGASYFSRHNERLATLQCYTTDGARQFDGTMGVSYQTNDLIGMGLQDNGNVFGLHGDRWKRLDWGDGGYFTFVRSGHAVRRILAGPLALAEWDGSRLVDRGAIGVFRPRPGPTPPTTLNGGFAIVNAPVSWDIFGAQIFGYTWHGLDLYSLWNPSGFLGWRFEHEGAIPMAAGEAIATGGSANGQVAFVGTSLGRVFSFDRRTRTFAASAMNTAGIPSVADYGINRLTILSDTLGFALFNRWRNGTSTGFVLRFDGTRWSPLPVTVVDASGASAPLPPQRFWSLEADWTVSPNTLFLTTDDKLYVSRDNGATWRDESSGLPRRAHLADLRFVVFPRGVKRLYVSTFGRSVWFADVP